MEVYLVGGAVRDQLMGLAVKDRDWVVVGSSPSEMLAKGFKPVGKDFPVFLHPETHEEYALARTEKKVAQGYHGFEFYADSQVTLLEDLQRRDLTINAIAQSSDGTIIDPFGGQHDIATGQLRHVSSAFSEDPVRVLRIAKFAARLPDFSIAEDTWTLLRQIRDTGELAALVPERVWQELLGALSTPTPQHFFQVLEDLNVLKTVTKLWHAVPDFNHIQSLEPSDLCARFWWSCMGQSAVDIRQNLAALRVPQAWRQPAEWMVEAVWQSLRLTPEDLVQACMRLDVWRRPDRFKLWLNVCANHPRLSNYKRLFQIWFQVFLAGADVDVSVLQAQGFTGVDLGEAIRQQRIHLASEVLAKAG